MINGNEEIRGIIVDFKKLATKIQQDNGQVKKTLKDREVALDACKKEYQKLYHEHETLKKSISSSNKSYNSNQNSKKLQTFTILL